MLKYTICFLYASGSVLLLNRQSAPWMGRWNGVGGKLEPGETPLQGAVREIHEETGLELAESEIRYSGTVTWSIDGVTTGGMYTFVAELNDPSVLPTPTANEEGILDWKPIEWVLHPNNQGIASNLPYYLPALLDTIQPVDHHCTFEQGVLTAVTVVEPSVAG
ncbi:NUDIX hydrolase [Paenibacillus koleovorans]|uniref:NUDIX hydrolase n=1 Tax=Paenibacillus koleovorans TaxID=121608 RepID=UPI000FD96045|nr:8-oxo-dGTP diphosphatase [Paenibacillus koleovorans]